MAVTAPSTNLSFLLAQASHALATRMTAALEEVGISPRAWCVLQKAMTGEYTQIELAQANGLDKTTMVVTIDALEAAGLAERRPSATDRRARIIAVTEAGERAVAAGQEIVDRVHAGALSELPAPERDTFLDALSRLVSGPLSEPAACKSTVRRRS